MFERYTERARRVIFFAWYEASQFGSTTIETEHFLLGLIREDNNLLSRFIPGFSAGAIRKEIEEQATIGKATSGKKTSTSIDLPLSVECMRILAYANEERERLNQRHIGTHHLLLAILREEKSLAAQILDRHGIKVGAVRNELALTATDDSQPVHSEPAFAIQSTLPEAGIVPDADTAKRIAEAVWIPLYGSETVKNLGSPEAEARFNVWLVTGSVSAAGVDDTLFAFIARTDGRILNVGRGPKGSHG